MEPVVYIVSHTVRISSGNPLVSRMNRSGAAMYSALVVSGSFCKSASV